ncbi:RNA helicase, partial [Vibrio parahaemolyticus]
EKYKIRYFEKGKRKIMIVAAKKKKVAHNYYRECGKHNRVFYSIRQKK